MHVLVLGASGLLGSELLRQATLRGDRTSGTYLRSPGTASADFWACLDLRDRHRVLEFVEHLRPGVVINAAFRQGDWSSTADGAANAAIAAAQVGARLVHVSSDAVFSGNDSPYAETAAPDPMTPYGAAKAAAECAVRAIAPGALVARTSLILSDDGASVHERRVVASVVHGDAGVHFTDDVRCPVHVTDLAAAVLELAATDRAGIHHLAGPDALDRYELGRLMAIREGLDAGRLRPGRRTSISGTPGPLDVRLDCTETRRHLNTELRGARQFLRERP